LMNVTPVRGVPVDPDGAKESASCNAEITKLSRKGSGCTFAGMLSHVFRPITTALLYGNADDFVICEKNRRSLSILGHGKVPLYPMPPPRQSATIILNSVTREEDIMIQIKYRMKTLYYIFIITVLVQQNQTDINLLLI
jgi:hypothetical protein